MSTDGHDGERQRSSEESYVDIRGLPAEQALAIGVVQMAAELRRLSDEVARVRDIAQEAKIYGMRTAATDEERHRSILASQSDIRHSITALEARQSAPTGIERAFLALPPLGRYAIVGGLLVALIGGDDLVRDFLRSLSGGIVQVGDVQLGGGTAEAEP